MPADAVGPVPAWADRLATGAAAATAAAMIAFPLGTAGGRSRRRATTAVVAGLAATTAAAAARRWGGSRTAAAVAVVAAGTTAIEHVGTTTGIPFGRYTYTGRLRPAVAGVPIHVPLAWWAMAVPAREAAHAALAARSTASRRVGLGALALAAWDLFLDPQMTAEDYWRWPGGGSYRGIPATNFAGWVATAAAVMAALEALLPPGRADRTLVAEYAAMAAMETVGFAVFFRDRLVAAAGAAAMVPLAALALVRSGRG